MALHPLDPATSGEIQQATDVVKGAYSGISLHFKAGGLEEPSKAAMVDFPNAEHNSPLPFVERRVFLMWYIEYTPRLFEGIVDLDTNTLVHHVEMPRDFHGPVDRAETKEAAQVVMKDPRVQAEIKRLETDDSTVVLDPWGYGIDGEDT